LYVHARVNGRYVLAPTGVPIPGDRDAEAVVLGYGDRLPWRRKPRVQPLPAGANPMHCLREPQ
jgi:hypothetical protein